MELKEKPFKFVVRLPVILRNQIADAATHYRRSMNSEIVARLEQTFRGLLNEIRDGEIAPPMHAAIESLFGRRLSDEEEKIISAYRRLTAQKTGCSTGATVVKSTLPLYYHSTAVCFVDDNYSFSQSLSLTIPEDMHLTTFLSPDEALDIVNVPHPRRPLADPFFLRKVTSFAWI